MLKLILAPALVAAASLMGRRFGPKMSGWVAGFPIVAGPILYFFAIEQSLAFAAQAAGSALQGLISLAAFAVAYTWAGKRHDWHFAMPLGWLAFSVFTVAQQPIQVKWQLGLPLAIIFFWLARRVMPHVKEPHRTPQLPGWDIPFRLVTTAGLVLLLTGLAQVMGPQWSGLLTPFPIASSVLAGFAHAHGGLGAAEKVLKTLLLSLQGFAVFLAVIAASLENLGILASFSLALGLSALVQALVLKAILR